CGPYVALAQQPFSNGVKLPAPLAYGPRRRRLIHLDPTSIDYGRTDLDGQAGFPRKTPWFRLPVVRSLRRPGVGLGLRPAGGRTQAEHQGPLVAVDGPRPRRHRGEIGRAACRERV